MLRFRRTTLIVLLAVLCQLVGMFGAPRAEASGTPTTTERRMAHEIAEQVNRERLARGLPVLAIDPVHGDRAHIAADRNAASRCYACHSHGVARPGGAGEVAASMPDVSGVGTGNATRVWMQSSGHRSILMDPQARHIAMGVTCANGRFELVGWVFDVVTVSSVSTSPVVTQAGQGSRCVGETRPAGASAKSGAAGHQVVYLRNTNSSGTADIQFRYGTSNDRHLTCDWNGDGIDTIGVFRQGSWFVRDRNSSGNADKSFVFGTSGDVPLCGDWNGDGIETVGVRRGSQFLLSNRNGNSSVDINFSFGASGDRPIAGDWNADGIDTIGVRRGTTFLLRNANSGGPAGVSFNFGSSTDRPVSGDWNGDGYDSIGVRRGNRFLLRNNNSSGPAQLDFGFGKSADRAVTGDWNGNFADSVGIARP